MAHLAAISAQAKITGDPVLARLGSLEVRLATSAAEYRAAARLRHTVFCSEAGLPARPSGLETDSFDAVCDHIIVQDFATGRPDAPPPIVGTSRMLLPGASDRGFYSEAEFDLARLFARNPQLQFCEVGRTCIAPAHRTQPVLEALWRGLYVYAVRNSIDVFFGAASFPGTDPQAHAMALSWLFHNAVGDRGWTVEARLGGAVAMNRVPAHAIDTATALRQMPPLLRGYLKIGAHVSRSAYLDPDFSTIDVLVIAPLATAPGLWRRRFQTTTGMGLDRGAETVPITPDLL